MLDESHRTSPQCASSLAAARRHSSKKRSDLQVRMQRSRNQPASNLSVPMPFYRASRVRQLEKGTESVWSGFGRLDANDADHEEQQAESLAARRDQCGETILVVDDIDGVRDLIREVLEMDGYEVLLAEDGHSALHVARQHSGPIHLLLTDVVMPRMGGKDLADRIHEERPEVRVVFMSGYSDEAISRHGVLQPGTAFLKKPFTSDSLIRCVRQELDKA